MRWLIRVLLAGQLQDLTRGTREVELDAVEDLQAMVTKLERSFPGLGRRIVDDQGKIRTYVNVFVNKENSRELERERTKLKDGDVVHVLPSVAGG
jgi:MoaD family protein